MGQFQLSSACVITTCRLIDSNENMNGFRSLALFALLAGSASAAGPNRRGKNLRGTFPFNQRNGNAAGHAAHDHHHEHEHAHAHEHNAVDARGSRQGGGDDVSLDIGSIAAAGERCIDKVVMVEETEYDDVIECKHSYSQKCHTTYTTDFEPQQEEECEETFTKNCFIEYKKAASEETVKFCHTPILCTGEGEPETRTVYESQCSTSYHKHDVEDDVVDCKEVIEEKCEPQTQGYTTELVCSKWPRTVCTKDTVPVTKHTPETACTKVPRQITGPAGCKLEPGPEECFDKKETVIVEVPEETCNLEPQKSCKFVTKLVPFLKPAEECVDIPKEVCSRSRQNPRPVQKPVVKKWCYVPSEESGLA